MSADYDIKVDEEMLAELTRRMETWGGNTDLALSRALNSAANRARSSTALPGGGASQRMRKLYNIGALAAADPQTGSPVRYINTYLKVFGANRNRLSAKVYSPKRSPLLSMFAVGNTGQGETPTVNVRKDTGRRVVGLIPQTRREVSPFYARSKQGNTLLILGIRRSPGPRGGRTRAARTMGVGQMFNWMKDDMLPTVQKDFEDQLISKMQGLLKKMKVPMEDPGGE